MAAEIAVDRDHEIPVQVHRGEAVMVYNRLNSADVVNYYSDGYSGTVTGGLKPDEAKLLKVPGTYRLSTPTHADVKLIGGSYGN